LCDRHFLSVILAFAVFMASTTREENRKRMNLWQVSLAIRAAERFRSLTRTSNRTEDDETSTPPPSPKSPGSRPMSAGGLARTALFWCNIHFEARTSRHKFYKNLISDLVRSGALKIEFLPKEEDLKLLQDEKKRDKRKEGNAEMHSPESLRARESVRRSVSVIAACDTWWKDMHEQFPDLVNVNRRLYVALFSLVYAVLLPTVSVRERMTLILDDYKSDVRKSKALVLDHHIFMACLFELADVWTDSTDESEYVDFLNGFRMTWSPNQKLKKEFDAVMKCFRGKTERERELEETSFALKAKMPDPYERYTRMQEAALQTSATHCSFMDDTAAFKQYRRVTEDSLTGKRPTSVSRAGTALSHR
jgi:hypothetical protein